ncbi:hypothetical protein BD309DRAFT_965039 [Dichomitus squalens]|uniref:Uncharacterized protein n=1 Tax=Dichomitus squalens TaxID=114155 RepID=A0A4Q9PQT7_9APHY|nr:hypothetical protein BD309DRAFT_965039 [Dichomitus squalens]TBU56727.1 hypothetical protein BD310DRAFT_930932 [Dichomitus squalens]
MQFVPYSSYCDVCRLPVFARPAPDPPRLRHGQARVPRRPLHAAHDRLNREHGFLVGPHAPHLDKPPAEVYPLAASCAACKTDASAQDDMKRCSACRMTRLADCPRSLCFPDPCEGALGIGRAGRNAAADGRATACAGTAATTASAKTGRATGPRASASSPCSSRPSPPDSPRPLYPPWVACNEDSNYCGIGSGLAGHRRSTNANGIQERACAARERAAKGGHVLSHEHGCKASLLFCSYRCPSLT